MITNLPKSLLETSSLLLEASLYESILLLENRIEFLKKNNTNIDTSHDSLAQHRDAGDVIDHFSQNADPSKNKQHTQWILGQYKKKNIRQEDAPRIHDVLSSFDKYKSKLDKKDINQYKSVSDLENAVRPHLGTAATNSEVKQETINKGRTLIHDNGKGLTVYRLENTPEGKATSQEIYGGGHELGGTHTSWCTAYRGGQGMFDHYSKKEPLHVIHTPSGNVYQAHPSTNQLMDAKDIDVRNKHQDIEHIANGLDHVPNGWKLKLGRQISLNSKDINKALDDSYEGTRQSAASSPNATKEHLDKALNDESFIVRTAAASNPNATKEHLDKALNDNNGIVRISVSSNPNATKEHLDKLKNDNDPFVRGLVANITYK